MDKLRAQKCLGGKTCPWHIAQVVAPRVGVRGYERISIAVEKENAVIELAFTR